MERLGFGIISVGILVAIYFTFCANFIHFGSEYSTSVLSEYGGFIGGTIGSLFSLAGYLLIYEGLRTNKLTAFENTYFNLISTFNEFRTKHIGLIETIEGEQPKYHKGQDFFEFLFLTLINPKGKLSWDKISEKTVTKHLEEHKSQLSQYFGMLDMVLKKIDMSNLRTSEKLYYQEYLLNILNDQEQFLIVNKGIIFPSKYDNLSKFASKFGNRLAGRKYLPKS